MSSFLAARVSTDRSRRTVGFPSPSRPLAIRSSTVTGITSSPRLAPGGDWVASRTSRSGPLRPIAGRAEQCAGRSEVLGTSVTVEEDPNRRLRAERREQVTAVSPPHVIRMHGDAVNKRAGRPLAPIRTPMGSAPEKAAMQLLHQTWRSRIDRLNTGRRRRRLAGKVRRPAAVQRVDERPDVVGAAEAEGRHVSS